MESPAAAVKRLREQLRKRLREEPEWEEVFYDVAPLMAPIGFVPFLAASELDAELCARTMELNWLNPWISTTLDYEYPPGWRDGDELPHISISLTYKQPAYASDWGYTKCDVQPQKLPRSV